MKCRHCDVEVKHGFVDLGMAPPSNSYLSESSLKKEEAYYPLKVLVCDNCWLVQTEDFVGVGEMFSENYAYYSSFSSSWLRHAESYVERMIDRFSLNGRSNVVEVAANDGYLLQYVKRSGIQCYGIEPTKNTAEAAKSKGIEIIEEFFGEESAMMLVGQGRQADLIVANNVLAHVPDINDFVKGFSLLLKESGVVTFEFPHLLSLVTNNQFDTIYHEHFSYLSLIAVKRIFSENGLSVFDVERLKTHGGSLRVYAQRSDSGLHAESENVGEVINDELRHNLNSLSFYSDFQQKVENIKKELLNFLSQAKDKKLKIVAYGAAAKGNTLLNFAGITSDDISYVVDLNPSKQGLFMPGSRIPIVDEDYFKTDKPDVVIIFPWNLKEEIMRQLDYIRAWDAKFVTVIPWLKMT